MFTTLLSKIELVDGGHSSVLRGFHFSTNFIRFSPKISSIFMPVPLVLLHIAHSEFFDRFLIKIIEYLGNFYDFLGHLQKNHILQISFRQPQKPCKMCYIFEISPRPNGFLARKYVEIFKSFA